MDADWGSSSDEEEKEVRKEREEAKRKETMALLEAFDRTREPADRAESGYGAIDSMDANARFKNERSQRGGKDMWKGRVGTSQEAESGIESDINSSMKWPMLLGCIMIVVLLCALVGVRMEQQSASGSSSPSTTSFWSNSSQPHGPSAP